MRGLVGAKGPQFQILSHFVPATACEFSVGPELSIIPSPVSPISHEVPYVLGISEDGSSLFRVFINIDGNEHIHCLTPFPFCELFRFLCS